MVPLFLEYEEFSSSHTLMCILLINRLKRTSKGSSLRSFLRSSCRQSKVGSIALGIKMYQNEYRYGRHAIVTGDATVAILI